MVGRRNLVMGLALTTVGLAAGGSRQGLEWLARAQSATPKTLTDPTKLLAQLEARSTGRLGVAVLDLETGRRYSHRGDERFPMCSVFKWTLAACVLARVDKGQEDLGRRIVFDRSDLQPHSPGTEGHVGPPGMTLAALCEAAVTLSDNAAANLLLKTVGGPSGLTAWLRSQGDKVTRLDRWETALNSALPGDARDTTSPDAMIYLLNRLTQGQALSPASRTQLNAWLAANTTGDARLRAGLPAGWRTGDKTGSGDRGTTNDVAVITPPGRRPLLVAAFLTGGPSSNDARNAILADVGRVVVAAV